MARLTVSLLGPLTLTLDEEPVAALTAKMQALLAYLAVEADRPHRREILAGLLWPEQPEEAARNSLRQALHQLQRTLGESAPPFLFLTPQTAQFNTASDASVDVTQFISLFRECEQHIHRRRDACPSCFKRLQKAGELYRGDLLAGLLLKDCTPFEEWVLIKREQLARMALVVLHSQAEYHAREGNYERMERAARRQLEIDSFREDAHRQLMCALTWGGQRNTALAHYHACRRMLAEELKAEPEQETTALYEQIQANARAAPSSSPRGHLPAAITLFVGRERELGQLAEWLQDPAVRLVTLTGPGGIGKTRLALQAAEREAAAFADGTCFVSLAAVAGSEFVIPAIASALGVTLGGAGDPTAQLLESLREKELLLLLDSFEPVIAAAPLVAELLAACPRLTVLATSRERLHVRGERQFRVPPLRLPVCSHGGNQGKWEDGLESNPAIMLFVDRARAVQPDFVLDEKNAAAVAEICVRLDGLPLAIELAAARSSMLSPAHLLERLPERLTFLTEGYRDLPARQQTLRATLDWSYALLTAGEKRLLARLGVFTGGCTMQAAEAVCGDRDEQVSEDMTGLVDKSLLSRAPDGGDAPRFVMLDTVREYAWEQLSASGEEQAVQRRHAAYYLALVEQAEPELKGSLQRVWLDRLESEHNNLRAALRWALDRPDAEIALRLSGALYMFWWWHGDLKEAHRWLDAALAAPSTAPENTAAVRGARAKALTGAGAVAHLQGDQTTATAFLIESLALARATADRAITALALEWLGIVTCARRQDQEARAYLEECLALCRESGAASQWDLAMAFNALGNVVVNTGDPAGARPFYEQSLAIRREIGSQSGVACSLYNLGCVAHAQGEEDRAAALFREELCLARELKNKQSVAEALAGLALVAQARGQATRGAQLMGQAEALFDLTNSSPDPTDRAAYDRTIAALRGQLGEAAFVAAQARGAAMTLEEAIAYALQP